MMRLRVWLSDRCADLGTWLYHLASKIDPGPQGEPCPDCGVPTTVPLDQPCPECANRSEAQHRDTEIYHSGFMDGERAADEEADRRVA